MNTTLVLVEVAALALGLASTVWVLGIQALGLLRSMPRTRFLALQMQLVRVWARALAFIAVAVGVVALARSGLAAWPAVIGAASAVVSGVFAVPRALRAGAESIRNDTNDVSAASFLVDGGGEATRVWHRVVLACVVVVVAGLGHEAYALAHAIVGHGAAHQDTAHPARASSSPPSSARAAARVPIDRATLDNLARLERDAAALLAADAASEASAVPAAWNRIFRECTTEGDAHDALHTFLAPLAELVARVETRHGPERQRALRELLREIGRFEERFVAADLGRP